MGFGLPVGEDKAIRGDEAGLAEPAPRDKRFGVADERAGVDDSEPLEDLRPLREVVGDDIVAILARRESAGMRSGSLRLQ